MKKVFLSIFIVSFCFTEFLLAQQLQPSVMASTGYSNQQNNVQISYTVGEAVIHTLTNNNNTLTQGFQQPHYNITLIPQHNEINTNILIYPNPAQDKLLIQSPFEKETTWEISLFDMNGKCLYLNKTKVQPKSTITVYMNSFASGKYILSIYLKENHQTFKYEIVKNK